MYNSWIDIYLGKPFSDGKTFKGFSSVEIISLLAMDIAASGTVDRSIVILINLLY